MPWVPVIDMLTSYFDIRSNDEAATRREKVRLSLTNLDSSLQDALPYLYDLFGIAEFNDPLNQTHPLIKRARTLDAVKRIILTESHKRPLVLIFEDVQWVDAQSRSLLDLLADSIADADVLLVVTYRREFKSEWRGKENYSEVALQPLDVTTAEQLLSTLTPDVELPPPLKKYVVERADGNPFFLEEIVRSLREDGSLVLNAGRLQMPVGQLRVPQTVQATIAERIDRLPATEGTPPDFGRHRITPAAGPCR